MSIFSKKSKADNVKRAEADQDAEQSAPARSARQDRNPVGSNGSDTKASGNKLSADERRELARATLEEQKKANEKDRVDVSDRTVRMLLDEGYVLPGQVGAALERGADSSNLWRMLVDLDNVNAGQVYEAVARMAGIGEFLYLDAAPSREFIDELVRAAGGEVVLSLLDRGLLPVDQEPGLDIMPASLVLATFDPTHPSITEFAEELPFAVECKYANKAALEERIETVASWLTDMSRFGTAPILQEAEEDRHASEQVEDVIDLGSYDSEDGLIIETPEDEDSTADLTETTPTEAADTNVEEENDDAVTEEVKMSEAEAIKRTAARVKHPSVKDRVLDWLLRNDVVTMDQVKEAQAVTKNDLNKDAAWRYLADMPGISRADVFREVADLYAFKRAEINEDSPDHDFVRLTMETIGASQRDELIDALLIPYEHSIDMETGTGRMIFVTNDPTRQDISKMLHSLDLGRFELQYAPEKELKQLIQELFPRRNEFLDKLTGEDHAFDLGTNHDESGSALIDEEALEAEMSRSNLINLFEASLVEAVRQGVSDVHIFPNPNRQVEIHFRTDGRLKKWHTEDSVHPEAFLAVVKDNSSNVDRFERDKAQDGFIQRVIDDTLIRFRVSILPIATANAEVRAESIVIRILDDRKVMTDLGALGMLDVAKERFDRAIRQPHGMVILTGPTGSGKSTTLVASLYQVVTPEVNVLTVEDPVEYIIKGVRQIKLNHKLDLESALRSILRHDPDIVMVGEMRDRQTAELAIKLANTGHLTFSTLHTNDAPAAISRLYKMGVEPFLIAYAINLVVAQRLIRTVCPDCRQIDDKPDRILMKSLGWDDQTIDDMTIFKANRGSGCTSCNSIGYKGRRALCETLYFSSEIRHMIAESDEAIDEEAIRDKAVEEGMLTLQDSARVLVAMGETTVEEMLRVTGTA